MLRGKCKEEETQQHNTTQHTLPFTIQTMALYNTIMNDGKSSSHRRSLRFAKHKSSSVPAAGQAQQA